MEQIIIDEVKEPKLYEIGYLLSPLLPNDKLADEATKLRSVIEEKKGLIVIDGMPKSKTLAYEIKQFETAYFGWIKFMAKPDIVDSLQKEIEKNDKVLRFLIMNTKKEVVEKPKTVKPRRIIKSPIATEAEPTEIKKEEVDKKLEELIGK